MNFVHIADMHFDSPFVNLADKEGFGDIRRMDQRNAFKKLITYIKENKIPYLFISGDLYEHKYVKKSTIQYINNLFQEISETKIFISPGNHDPYVKNSFYNQFEWSKNVKIFNSKIEKVSYDNVDIYGYGFNNFYCDNCGIENLKIENPEKINVLVIHGTLNGAVLEDNNYNPISEKTLKEKGFDYVALGHIHKSNHVVNTQDADILNNNIKGKAENKKIVYPGSTVSMGFDELGKHGMIVGKIEKNQEPELNFIKLDDKQFVEKEIDVTNILSKEELIEKINEEPILEKELAKIILIGKRHFEIEPYGLYKVIQNKQIIKIKNKTKIYYNLKEIANQHTLKGLFAKEVQEKMSLQNITEEEKDIIEKAVEIVFEALE